MDISTMPKSAEEAIEQGVRRFYREGWSCKHGHPPVMAINSLSPLKVRCAECLRESNRLKAERKRKDPEYREKTNAQIRACNNKRYATDENFRAALANKAHTARARTKFKVYDIDEDAYIAMGESQDWCCAICKEPEVRTTDEFRHTLAVDHCHTTGAVRGLLCASCNTALGLLKEKASSVEQMLTYIKEKVDVNDPVLLLRRGVTIKKQVWETFDEKETQEFKEDVFNMLREFGYPSPQRSETYLLNEIDLAKRYLEKTEDGVIHSNRINQTHHCTGALWGFFPHFKDVRCNNKPSPQEAFDDDSLLKKAITYRMRSGTYMNYNAFRRTIATTHGTQQVSNFRATAAANLYQILGGGVVYDPCAGWGGRLVGAEIANNVTEYVGVDACLKTVEGLKDVAKILSVKSSITYGCAEEIEPDAFADIVFTSPPYFDCEMYSYEETQSAVRYTTKEMWFENFMKRLIDNSIGALKSGGKLALNVANVPSYPTLEQDVFNYMNEHAQLEPHMFLSLILSSKSGGERTRSEPVFVFKKL